MPEYTFLDLFAGAGGFTEGLLLASYDTSQFRLLPSRQKNTDIKNRQDAKNAKFEEQEDR